MIPVVLVALAGYGVYRWRRSRGAHLVTRYVPADGDTITAVAKRFDITGTVLSNVNPGKTRAQFVAGSLWILPPVTDRGAQTGAMGKAS